MTLEQFRAEYLEELELGQVFDLFGYKPAGVLSFVNNTNEIRAQAHNILRQRAARDRLSGQRCKNAKRSEHLWELTTDGGARFLYFQSGPRELIFVSATYKMKERKFNAEIVRADRLRSEYLTLKEGHLR